MNRRRPAHVLSERTLRPTACIAWIGIGLAVLIGTGCMLNPKDKQRIPDWKSSITFNGLVGKTPQSIDVYAQNQSTWEWVKLGSAHASSTPITDAVGDQWYSWSVDLKVPFRREFWVSYGLDNEVVARVKAVTDNGKTPLTSFDKDTGNACLTSKSSLGFAEAGKQCAASRSPETMVIAPCGHLGQLCCSGNNRQCLDGLGCGPDPNLSDSKTFTCQPCGGVGQVCCGGDPGVTCNGTKGLACPQYHCVACGNRGQPCCYEGSSGSWYQSCADGLRCSSGGTCN